MIEIVAYLALVLLSIQVCVSFVNYLTENGLQQDGIEHDDMISVLIPARNEENNILNILKDLVRNNYKNIEILVFDDQSEDATADIVRDFASNHSDIQLITSNGLPKGWKGKNYACHTLAQNARGKYYLFLDADVRIGRNLIGRLLYYTKSKKPALVTIFPKQIMYTFGEKITIPIMNFILISLLPLILVRTSKRSSLAAANGQLMFFEAELYNNYLPHYAMKNQRVEDIRIARFYKMCGEKIACKMGDDAVVCHMYHNFDHAVKGFSKNIIDMLGGNSLFAFVFIFVNTFGWLFVALYFPIYVLGIYFLSGAFNWYFVSKVSNQNSWENIILVPFRLFSMCWIFVNHVYYRFTKSLLWKGRNIS